MPKLAKQTNPPAPTAVVVRLPRRARARRNRKASQLALATHRMGVLSLGGIPNITRSGGSNPADPRTRMRVVAQLGNTAAGRVDALRILHPCGEGTESLQSTLKIPDGAADASVSFERRDEYAIPAPAPAKDQRATPWNCLLLHLPLLKASRIAVRWPTTSTSVTRDYLEGVVVSALAYAESGAGQNRAVYPAWSTAGAATSKNLVEWTFLTASNLTPQLWGSSRQSPDGVFREVRRVNYGATVDLDASDMYNSGRVVEGQFAPDVSLFVLEQLTEDKKTVASLSDVYRFILPPVVSEDIVSTDRRSRQAEAKSGSYMPLRMMRSEVPFTPSAEYRSVEARGPSRDNSPSANDVVYDAPDLHLRSWNLGVSLFMGLAPEASLRLKTRETLELLTSANSLLAPVATPGHPDDTRAVQVLREYARTEPHAYPADYNERNAFWGNLVRGIGDVVATLGVPILSQVSGPLSKALAGWITADPSPPATAGFHDAPLD